MQEEFVDGVALAHHWHGIVVVAAHIVTMSAEGAAVVVADGVIHGVAVGVIDREDEFVD